MITVEPGRPGWATVTFRHGGRGGSVAVVGDFNQWRSVAPPGVAGDEEECRIEIPTGRAYRFRYLLDGTEWGNDDGADGDVPNELGTFDSVLDLRHDGPHADRLGLADSRVVRQQRGSDRS